MKPPTRFVQNLLDKNAITRQQAEILGDLESPHQQFAALQKLRASPGEDLAAIVQDLKAADARAHLERQSAAGMPRESGRALMQWVWQVLTKAELKSGFVKGALAIAFLGLLAAAALKGGPWAFRRWSQAHAMPSLVTAPAANKSVAQDASPAPSTVAEAPAAAALAHAGPVKGPAHFASHPSTNQMVQLTWDSLGDHVNYHLYSASSENMADAQLEEDSAIPVNWFNWLPPNEGRAVWLAVKGVLPSGQETRFSKSIRVEPTSAAAVTAPTQNAPNGATPTTTPAPLPAATAAPAQSPAATAH